MPLQNIADYCMSRFEPWTSFPALECSATGKQFTYGDVRTMARQFGSQLLDSGEHDFLYRSYVGILHEQCGRIVASGLRPGDRVATFVPNCPEFGPVLLGSLGVGVTLVPMSPMLGAREVARLYCTL